MKTKDEIIQELRLALKPFLFLKSADPEVEGDPIDHLEDGHGFEFAQTYDDYDNDGCGPCDVTAGQIRRARAAYEASA